MAKTNKAGGYSISDDKGKADSNLAGKGPGPIRGNSFGKVNSGPKQGEQAAQPKKGWSKGKMDSPSEGEGDAN